MTIRQWHLTRGGHVDGGAGLLMADRPAGGLAGGVAAGPAGAGARRAGGWRGGWVWWGWRWC